MTVEPFTDLQSAREAVRLLTRPKTELKEVKQIFSRLFVSDMDICLMSLRLILDNFDSLSVLMHDPVFKLTEFVFSRTTDISRIIPPLSALVGCRDQQIREKVVNLICSVGPLAKPAEDLAMGCLRNNIPEIRICGAKILFSIGQACSKSIVRQLKTYIERQKHDVEFCKLLEDTIKRIEMTMNSDTTRIMRRDSAAIVKILAGSKVMVVDDNPTLRETLTEMLQEGYGMTVLQAADGSEAIDLLSMQESDSIDYVILDLKMPEVNGIRVLQNIREESPVREAKVILATAVADARVLGVAEKFGISGCLRKPYRVNQVIRMMLEAHPQIAAALASASA